MPRPPPPAERHGDVVKLARSLPRGAHVDADDRDECRAPRQGAGEIVQVDLEQLDVIAIRLRPRRQLLLRPLHFGDEGVEPCHVTPRARAGGGRHPQRRELAPCASELVPRLANPGVAALGQDAPAAA